MFLSSLHNSVRFDVFITAFSDKDIGTEQEVSYVHRPYTE